MIDNFKEFNFNILLESLMNESMLYYSPIFRANLNQLTKKSKIAQILLDAEGKELKNDVTFVNFDKDEGYLTFLPMKQAKSKILSTWPDAIDNNLDEVFLKDTNDAIYNREINNPIGIYNRNFNKIKFGRFINKILDECNTKFSEKEIESFINDLKSYQNGKNYEIKIIKGEEIKKYYKRENYLINTGPLSSSCMTDRDYFELYSQNPEVCQMVIMSLGDKIVARALLWKLDFCSVKGVEYLLDRIYFNSDFQKKTLENFAYERKFAIRENRDSIYYLDDWYDNVEMRVKVHPIKYSKFPYLDTFTRYDDKRGYLYNDLKRGEKIKGHILNSTDGGFIKSEYKPNLIMKVKDWLKKE